MSTNATTQEKEVAPQVEGAVAAWIKRIRSARKRWTVDFDQMREDMRFAKGLQWNEQVALNDDRYVANLTLRTVNQKVAALYARKPTVKATRRKRLEYQIWDGEMESLLHAIQSATQLAQQGMVDMEAEALLADYQAGQAREKLIDKVGKTLEIVYDYQLDSQEPEFKTQMKALVRRVVTCGVGYVRLRFKRSGVADVSNSASRPSLQDRLQAANSLINQLAEDGAGTDDPRMEELKQLLSNEHETEQSYEIEEKLVLDFPASTRIIPDPNCTAIKGFVGADWIVQEYCFRLSFVRAFFELPRLTLNNNQVDDKQVNITATQQLTVKEPPDNDPMVYIWELFNKRDKTTCFLCDGYNDYLQEPQAVEPCLRSFWPVYALTFNDIEASDFVDSDEKRLTPFPPSDVQLIRSAQKEWNRSRNALRAHRKANQPKYIVPIGVLDEADMSNLANAAGNSIIQLKAAKDQDVSKILTPVIHTPIDPALYNTDPINQDILMSVGMQQENIGPADPDATATGATIAEQSRLTATSSNVDDLDDFLSVLARGAGELLMWEMSPDTVRTIAGPGAVWPSTDRSLYINEVFLEVEAASSGRPNKALEASNFERLAPLLFQAGANPMFMVEQAIKRLDDRLDVSQAFPLNLPSAPAANGQPQQAAPGSPSPNAPTPPGSPDQPLQQLMSQSPVPLVGA